MLFVEGESLLARLEEEAFAHFQQEALDLVDDGGFEIGLGIAAPLVQTEELQHQRFLEQVARVADGLPFVCEPANAFFVTAESEALVEAGVELALEFADCPVLLTGFNLVEAALAGVLDAEKEDVM